MTDAERIELLEKCLAGFMALWAREGGYFSQRQLDWFLSKIEGDPRTPMQVWEEVVGSKIAGESPGLER